MTTQWMKDHDAYPPDWCLFYRYDPIGGLQSGTCHAGVSYSAVEVKSGGRIYHPCFFSDMHDSLVSGKLHCDKMQYPTKEQVARYEEESRKSIERFMAELNSDICPHCHKPIEKYEQVGRCVYGRPCGHRLYQGKVPRKKAA